MKRKGLLRKAIYLILFAILGLCFILISEEYKDNSKPDEYVIKDYYPELTNEKYEIIGGKEFINLFEEGKHIIVIGSKKTDWSLYYMTQIEEIIKENNIESIYYYDINNDKAQDNKNYYDIKKLLKGSLISTDENQSTLLSPSFYIIEEGKVLYYNIDTVAMRNTDKPADYWNEETKIEFKNEITEALNKYYLNNAK